MLNNPQRFSINAEKSIFAFDSEFVHFTFLSSYGCMFRITPCFKGDSLRRDSKVRDMKLRELVQPKHEDLIERKKIASLAQRKKELK